MKVKVNMEPARDLFHILRYVSVMDLYPLHHLLTGLVLKKANKKNIKGHNLTFKSTDSPFFFCYKNPKMLCFFHRNEFLA